MTTAALPYKPFRFSKKAKAIIASLVTLSGTAVPTSLALGGVALNAYIQRAKNCGTDVDNIISQVEKDMADHKIDPGVGANLIITLLQLKQKYC